MFEDKNTMSIAEYQISKVSRLLGIPQQTIRYFDKEGVVVPSKNDHNGHRMYSIYDIYKITMRKQYKNLGCSVSDTKDILNSSNLEEIVNKLHLCEENLAQEKLLAELRCIGLEAFMSRIKKISTHLNRFYFTQRPASWHHVHMLNGKYVNNQNCTKARQMAMDLMPLCVYTFKFDYEDILKNSETEHYQWDISLDIPYSEKVEFHKISSSYYVPEDQCIYTIFKQLETSPIKLSMLHPAMDFIKQNRLELSDNIYGNIILNAINDNGDNERYFEAWLPIKTI